MLTQFIKNVSSLPKMKRWMCLKTRRTQRMGYARAFFDSGAERSTPGSEMPELEEPHQNLLEREWLTLGKEWRKVLIESSLI